MFGVPWADWGGFGGYSYPPLGWHKGGPGGKSGSKSGGKGYGKGKSLPQGGKSNVFDVKCSTQGCPGKARYGRNPPKTCYYCWAPFVYGQAHAEDDARSNGSTRAKSPSGNVLKASPKAKVRPNAQGSGGAPDGAEATAKQLYDILEEQGYDVQDIFAILDSKGLPRPRKQKRPPQLDTKDYNALVSQKNRLQKELEEQEGRVGNLCAQLNTAVDKCGILKQQLDETDAEMSAMLKSQLDANSDLSESANGIHTEVVPQLNQIFSGIHDAISRRSDVPSDFRDGLQQTMSQLFKCVSALVPPKPVSRIDDPDYDAFEDPDFDAAIIQEMQEMHCDVDPSQTAHGGAVDEQTVFPDNFPANINLTTPVNAATTGDNTVPLPTAPASPTPHSPGPGFPPCLDGLLGPQSKKVYQNRRAVYCIPGRGKGSSSQRFQPYTSSSPPTETVDVSSAGASASKKQSD